MLGDTLARTTHAKCNSKLNDSMVTFILVQDIIVKYEDYPFFGPLLKALSGKYPTDVKQK